MVALFVGVLLSGCGAPGVQLAAPVPAPEVVWTRGDLSSASSAQVSTETLWITVRDARQERPRRAIGVARVTMGIPRQIRQVGDWDIARAIGHGLGTGLQNVGWKASGFDPPDPRLVIPEPGPDSARAALPGWTLRLIIDRLWCDGYFNEYSFKLGFRLHLLDPSGRLRSRAELRREFVEEYEHPADFAYQVETKTRAALSTLLADLGMAAELPSLDPQAQETYFYNKYEKSKLDEDEDEAWCPKCEREVEESWKHCPDCGVSLGGGE